MPVKNIIICDIDGTVADLSHRLPLVKNGNHDWDTFHSLVDKDSPRDDVIALVQLLAANYKLYFVSGRNESSREKAVEWLKQHGLYVDCKGLYMRPENDTRDDRIIKKEILDEHFGDKKDQILMVIDDRPKVVAMWKQEGLDVLDVGPGPDKPF